MVKRFWARMMQSSLWLVSIGLMLASSGIDGAYLSRLMPVEPIDLRWMGYVLNTMSDVGSEVLMYWFGRLRLFPKNSKRYRMAVILLPAELLTIAYSWFFSWRQLLLIMPAVEPEAAQWVAPIAAGFIPLLLSAIGYAQALLAGRIEKEHKAEEETQEQPQAKQEAAQVVAQSAWSNGHKKHTCPYCGATASSSGKPFETKQAVSAHLRFCKARQAAQSESGKVHREN